MQDPRIKMVRKRLTVTEAVLFENLDSAVFDADLEAAVKRFQKRTT